MELQPLAQYDCSCAGFFFEGPGRKLSGLQQLIAATIFLSLSRCSRRPIIIKRIDQLPFSNAVNFTSKTDKIHVHAYPLPDVGSFLRTGTVSVSRSTKPNELSQN